MNRNLWTLAVVVVALLIGVGVVYAAVYWNGAIQATASTDDIIRNYDGYAMNISVYAHTADVQIIFYPYTATQDTSVIRAGVERTWLQRRHEGFKIIRPTSTIVDVEWWR